MLKIENIKLKEILKRFHLQNVILVVVILFNLYLISRNSGFIFEKDIITTFGDQRLYFEVSYNWFISHNNYLSPNTIGYPLIIFLLTVINQAKSWIEIMPSLISLQAFVITPLIYFLMIKFTNSNRLLQISSIILYFLAFGINSSFTLNKYLFLGLIPLSEPFSILFLLLVYISYEKYKKSNRKLPYLLLVSVFCSLVIWFRSIVIILVLPIFIDLLFDKKLLDIVKIIILMMVMYIPQVLVNWLYQGSIFFSGYIWWEGLNVVNQYNYKLAIYGFVDNGFFTIRYLVFNLKNLLFSYAPIIILFMLINKYRTNRLELFIIGASTVYLLLILSYWWSSADMLVDRFLLPLYFLLLYRLGMLRQIKIKLNK